MKFERMLSKKFHTISQNQRMLESVCYLCFEYTQFLLLIIQVRLCVSQPRELFMTLGFLRFGTSAKLVGPPTFLYTVSTKSVFFWLKIKMEKQRKQSSIERTAKTTTTISCLKLLDPDNTRLQLPHDERLKNP